MLSLYDAVTIPESPCDNPAHKEGKSTHKRKQYPQKTLGVVVENVRRFCPTKIGDKGLVEHVLFLFHKVVWKRNRIARLDHAK
jgi:hypothetical protein